MEIEKGSYKKGFKSLVISISIGLLVSLVFYLLYSTHDDHYSYGMATLGATSGLILFTTMIFIGVTIIVSLVYIVLYTRKNQIEALNVAVINVFMLWVIALIIRIYL